jgi:cation-transporting ATPase E
MASPPRHVARYTGLGTDEVAERTAAGQTNRVPQQTSRSLSAIVRANVLTRFNAILGALLVAVLAVGSRADGLFGVVLISNSAIGIIQEVRAKRTLDRLAVLSAPRVTVVRDGAPEEVALGDVVLDDLVLLRAGDQVPADGEVVESTGMEVDESLLTGEADAVDKQPGDPLLSGSIVVAGAGRFHATAVGMDAYAQKLTSETRRFTAARSELMDGINVLLRYISWALLIVGPILLVSQLLRTDESVADAVVGTVAALVGMVPEGLVLLTSIAFFVAALTLARRQVLVRELPAVEGLARVDVICLDKTGTITDGEIRFATIVPIGDCGSIDAALGALADDANPNGTLRALHVAFPPPDGWSRVRTVPFSSARKWSAATFAEHGTWIMGAPEMVMAGLPGTVDDVRAQVDELAASGQRILVVARSADPLEDEVLPSPLELVALLRFEESIRPDAADIFRYFRAQEVELKVISGDNPTTVGAVARRVELGNLRAPVDARELPDDPDQLVEVLDEHSVFGRVTPRQKRAFVGALQRSGHVVAMTGDGVNDALALKDADIGVAMGNGAPATRAVAQLVLLDGRFAHMPRVVAEGRRVIANIERVANLFLVKNVYAALLAVVVIIVGSPYPFLPRHLTVVSTLTIGVPAFFLSLAPNDERYRPGFLHRVITFSVPAGVIIAIAVYASYAVARVEDLTVNQARSAATVATMVVGLRVLLLVSRPLKAWKVGLVALMGAAFALVMIIPPLQRLFELDLPAWMLLQALAIGAVAASIVGVVCRLVQHWSDARVAA